ncbi:hypothetical protein [Antarcticirhabdus aurantiaca]|uniref:hypothetical protein n=1 Tax=Antarcticirhabdus aurantiaca TaxID=2606717 RepID=UPI00131C5B8A|nr:hypothetical protein [Antarcticirhabdus aurantiaca]
MSVNLQPRDRTNRFLAECALDLTSTPLSWVMPFPTSLLSGIQIPSSATARDVAILWMMLAVEAHCASSGEPHEARSIAIGRLSPDVLKRGGPRAAAEVCERLADLRVLLRTARLLAFELAPALTEDRRSIVWKLSADIRERFEDGYRLDRNRVAKFFRVEVGVACVASTRWAMSLYAVIGAATIKHRRMASEEGWIALSLPISLLVRQLGWSGHQQKDFRPKVLRPALRSLCMSPTSPVLYPRYLRIEIMDDRDEIIQLRSQRLGRNGTALDSLEVRKRLHAQRLGLADVLSTEVGMPAGRADEDGPLRQGFVF